MVTISAIHITWDSCFRVLKGYVNLARDQNKLYGVLIMKQNLISGLFLSLLLDLVHYLVAQMPAVCKEGVAKLKQDCIFQRQCKSIYGTIGSNPSLSLANRKSGGTERCSPEVPYLHNPVCWNAWSSHLHINNGSSQGNWNSVGCNLHWSLHIHLYLQRKGNKTLCWEEGIHWPAAKTIQ